MKLSITPTLAGISSRIYQFIQQFILYTVLLVLYILVGVCGFVCIISLTLMLIMLDLCNMIRGITNV
jgi:hypothetical protein